jgi:transcriptional regulator with XRE-family HTH domain/mannose-6-phosphate isomerase-like protein (cupin superfamily)
VRTDSQLGFRLQQRRKAVGLSLRQLAEKTNLSASFLSQVEHNKANLSLNSLQAVSEALAVPLLYFLSDDQEKNRNQHSKFDSDSGHLSQLPILDPVVKAKNRPRLVLPLSGVEYEMLVPSSNRKMVALMGKLSPGTGNIARRLREPTEEVILILSGKLLVGLENGEYILSPGDSIYFEGSQLNQLVCASDEPVEWITVITPAVF